MPSASLADLQTMIALRRVPLFRDLDPEDLYRLARVAEECWYPPGTALMQEGELGDELVVIIEGSVRVMQATDDGRERWSGGTVPASTSASSQSCGSGHGPPQSSLRRQGCGDW